MEINEFKKRKKSKGSARVRMVKDQSRNVFKVCLITFKIFHEQTPEYILELVSVTEPVRSFRSSDAQRLVVPKTRTVTYGDRSFTKQLSSFVFEKL